MSRLPPAFAKHLKTAPSPGIRSPQAEARKGISEALNRAKEHLAKDEVHQAEQICGAVLTRDPNNPDALLLAGSLARRVGDTDLAVTYLKALVALQPNSADARLNLAAALGEAHEHEEAIRHFERALALRPESLAALGGLAKSYTAAGKAERSLPLFTKATKLHPTHAAVRLDHADALIALGRMDDAAKLLRENIARGYHVGNSYRSLADTQKFKGEPVELGAILGHLHDPGMAKASTVSLHHAAGKILNDVGRFEEAVDQFQASKIAAGQTFDLDSCRRGIDTFIAAFTPGLLRAKAAFGDPSEVPVVIVGMPRSGTSLTEQICASHPDVFGAGELTKLGAVVRSKGYVHSRNGSIQRSPQAVTAEEVRSMSAEYLGFLQRLSPSSARIIDKMPHNFMQVGMFALLFPNARIMHCTRDPIDNCLSCFFSTFNEKHGYNTDLRTLGLYYREYHRLMQHWNALLPGRIYECNYETMIADQEGESRRLIDFLGLPWDDACLHFYETDRSVITPSRWQVRQPIYATSVKRWKKYENKIQPLIEALGDLAVV